MSNLLISLDKKSREEAGIRMSELILVSDLGYYGFNSEIIDAMRAYEIWPDTYRIRNKIYVHKPVIFGIVETFMQNTMRLYHSQAEAERKQMELAEMLDADKVPLTKEELDRIKAGEIILTDLLWAKKEALDHDTRLVG